MTASDIRTVAEAAELLDLSHSTVKRMAEDGRLTAVRKDPWMLDGASVDAAAAKLADELTARADSIRAQIGAAASSR